MFERSCCCKPRSGRLSRFVQSPYNKAAGYLPAKTHTHRRHTHTHSHTRTHTHTHTRTRTLSLQADLKQGRCWLMSKANSPTHQGTSKIRVYASMGDVSVPSFCPLSNFRGFQTHSPGRGNHLQSTPTPAEQTRLKAGHETVPRGRLGNGSFPPTDRLFKTKRGHLRSNCRIGIVFFLASVLHSLLRFERFFFCFVSAALVLHGVVLCD